MTALSLSALSSTKAEQPLTLPHATKTASIQKIKIAVVEILDSSNMLPSVTALHTQVRNNVPKGQPPVLVPKPDSYFLDLLNGKTGKLLGCFIDGELAGITALVWGNTFAQAHSDGLITCTDQGLAKQFDQSPIAVIQSVCVKKKYGQNGLCKALIGNASSHAKDKGCKAVLAQVASHNAPSLGVFGKLGFKQASTWNSPNSYPRVLLHKSL